MDSAHTTSALLLLLLDSRSPAGAHHHSHGMEPAIAAGLVADVDDVERFCRGRLQTSGRVSAAAAAAACRLSNPLNPEPERWAELDDAVTARTASQAARLASRQLGSGLRRLLRATLPGTGIEDTWRRIPPPAPHAPIVLGAACGLAGAGPELAARAAALGACTGPASAATRLLSLDPYAVHSMLAGLAAQIDAAAAEAAAAAELPAGAAPALDLLADVHAASEVRLFAS